MSTRQESLRTEIDALREENASLKDAFREREELRCTQERHERDLELARLRAVNEERKRSEEREARLLALLEERGSLSKQAGVGVSHVTVEAPTGRDVERGVTVEALSDLIPDDGSVARAIAGPKADGPAAASSSSPGTRLDSTASSRLSTSSVPTVT
jgi:hypothetical protein